jgi:hypothetical protein
MKTLESASASTMRAIGEFSAAVGVSTAVLARYVMTTGTSAAATEQLVTSLREARLAWAGYQSAVAGSLSPLLFASATVSASILLEQTTKLVNARAKLIEQQSLFSALTATPFQSVDQLDLISRISGANPTAIRSLFTGLQSEWANNQSGVQASLDRMGLSVNVGNPEILGRIAEGLHAIEDPAKRAEEAVQLFGAQAGEALQILDGRFATSADSVRKYGIVLDETARTQIHGFRQDLLDFKNQLIDFSEQRTWWQTIKTGSEEIAASLEQMSKRGLDAIDRFVTVYTMGFIPGEGPADRYKPTPPSVTQQNRNRDAVAQTLIAQDYTAEAEAAKQRRDQTLEGQRAIRDAAESRRDDLLNRLKTDEAKRQNNPNDPTLMAPNERFSVALQQKSAEDMAAAVGRHVQAMEEADQAAKDAAKAADAALKSIEGYERSIREQGLTPVGRVYARRDDLGFSPGSAFGNRASVAADSEAKRILDEEQQRIDKQNATLYAPRPFQSAAPGEKGISLGLDLSGDIDKVNKQIDEAMKTWAGNIEARLKNTAIPLQQVALAGRERDEQSALGQNAENRLRLQAQYDQQRVHSFQEEVAYQKQISALEAADLQIKLQAAQQKEADAGQDVVKQARAALEVDRARLAIQEQQLKVLVQQAQLQAQNPFAGGSLKSGWDQFIHDASVQAEQPGKILYDSLNRGIDGISANMAKMLTGQKSAWAQTFKEIGDEMVKASIKAELLTLIGKIPGTQTGQAGTQTGQAGTTGGSGGAISTGQGGLFGGGSLGGGIFSFLKSVLKKPASGDSGQSDDSGPWVPPSSPSSQGRRLPDGLIDRTGPTGFPGDPVHVIQDGGQGSANNGTAGLFGAGALAAGGGLASLLSAGGQGATEAVSSSISFAGEFANGGYIPSGSYGIAGENGPEPVFGPAHVMSNKDFRQGGGGSHVTYVVHAPGAELGAVNRIERGLEAVHGSIERRAARAVYESNRRTPRNRK